MIEIFLGMVVLAFVCEFVDSSLGMGYGTTLTPLLLIFGFPVLGVVPAVLFSEFLSGITAGALHHKAGNVNFKKGSKHLKVAMVLAAFSIVGTVAAVLVAVNIPKIWLKTYIGALVLLIGLFIFIKRKKEYNFSWKKIMGLGALASFNKGMSGGGYGPVVVGGQILSGMDGKNAIGITSLAEGLTCIVGVIAYIATEGMIDFSIAAPLAIGAMLSVPFAVFGVKKVDTKLLKIIISIATLVLGSYTLLSLWLL